MSLSLIEKKLAQLRSHLRLTFLSWGIALAMIWASGLTLWLYYTDRILKLPSGLRIAFLVGALAILLIVVIRNLLYPLSRSLSDEDLALMVEREYPLLNDRLISSLQMLKEQERYKDTASPEMMRAVVAESFDIAGKLRFNDAVRSRRLLRVVGLSMVAMLLVFGHAWLDRDDMSLWVRRAMGGGPEWPTRTQLEVLILDREELSQYPTTDELDLNFIYNPEAEIPELGARGIHELAAGSDLRIVARPTGRLPSTAEIRITAFQRDPETGGLSQSGRTVVRTMETNVLAAGEAGEQVYFAYNKLGTINAVEQITIRAGDAVAGPFTLRVIPPPELTSPLEIVKTYPQYLVLPQETTTNPEIEAVAGTRMDVRFATSKPLQLEGPDASALVMEFTVGSAQRFPIDTDAAAGENRYRVRVPALQVGMNRWRLRLVDRQGIENRGRTSYLLHVQEDSPPTVRIRFSGDPLVPNQPVFITRDATIPIEYVMRDDYGVGSARMFWRLSSDDTFIEYEPFAERYAHLMSSPEREVSGTFNLEFARLLGDRRLPPDIRVGVDVYIQAFDLNQVRPDEDSPPEFQGSRSHTYMNYEIYDLEDLRARVSSQIRAIKTNIRAARELQQELLLVTQEALDQPGALDFRDEAGQELRRDLNEAFRRQNQLLRDSEVLLTRFGVFAQAYQFNRLERDDIERPQESRIQSVRLLLAIGTADRELQQIINNPLVRLEEAEGDTSIQLARELVRELSGHLRQARPSPGVLGEFFARLVQLNSLFSPACIERARAAFENLLEINVRPAERRELLVELQRQQRMTLRVYDAIQQQVNKWEGFDEILQGFRAVRSTQADLNEEIAQAARGD
jgi:hypothetical protein